MPLMKYISGYPHFAYEASSLIRIRLLNPCAVKNELSSLTRIRLLTPSIVKNEVAK